MRGMQQAQAFVHMLSASLRHLPWCLAVVVSFLEALAGAAQAERIALIATLLPCHDSSFLVPIAGVLPTKLGLMQHKPSK